MKEKSITHKGTTIGYFEEGSGFPIVFVHGFPFDHAAWAHGFTDAFTKNYRVILPDNAGFGKSGLPDEDVTMEYYADCIKAILDNEKISSCLMIGHSMGGYMVLNFAQRFPNYLKGFGLFSSTAYADDDAKKQNRIEVANNARKMSPAEFVNSMLHKLFGEKYAATHENEINEFKKYFGSVATSEGIAQASLAMGKRADTSDVLKNAKVPVHFIIGNDDKVVPPEKTLPLTSLPEQSVIATLEGTGHMGMIEAMQESQNRIQEWIDVCNVPKSSN
ncbi:MAG TPA: alpha/beta hydrolase [Chitinophagales bacterium]|nr:alpha/beta hydrolase [Chitinophagales bacterium]